MTHASSNDPQTLTSARPLVWLLAFACVLITGCATPPPPEPSRDECLDAGPAKSAAYDACEASRTLQRAAALRALLDDTGASNRQMALADPEDIPYQEADFPDIASPMRYRMNGSITVIDKQALPFKVRVTWKYTSKTFLPEAIELERMDKMEDLLLSAVKDQGPAKWVCTVTGEHRREWIFYTPSDLVFISRLQSVLAPTGPYPVEWSTRKEPLRGANGQTDNNLPDEVRITPKLCME
ncbi:DUF695 domain-containing protein [Pseudomonas sp. P2757]|uniref:DUF695 domain-containing protein n=1 Tax=unclassified Pseudomonas TaxID=196821 RepID=UPI003B5A2261